MKKAARNPVQLETCKPVIAVLALLIAILLVTASGASAAYEQVGTFAGIPGLLKTPAERSQFPEQVQLGGVGGMAVNINGVGGVPAGTVYAAGYPAGATGVSVARYNADGTFSEYWEVTEKGEYERCGPDVPPTEPLVDPNFPACPPHADGSLNPVDVDVDQATGNVYVYNGVGGAAGSLAITEYSADGSEVIARFGEYGVAGEATAESPGKLHGVTGVGGNIAVNAAGEVYVSDLNFQDNFYHRLMVFKPQSPGDYEHYVYAGEEHDIAAGFQGETSYPSSPVADAAGNLYVASGGNLEKYEPAKPATPVCKFIFSKGQIVSLTVNPATGEPFFFSFSDHKAHRLSACNEEGRFAELEALKPTPPRAQAALTVNPSRQFEPSRAPGVLYVGSPGGAGGAQAGESPSIETESSMGYIFATPNEVPPAIESESVASVTASSARLQARVNPKGSPTHYVFQYIGDAAYQANEPSERFAGASEAPLGGGLIEGSAGLPIAIAITGLSPQSEYHYRVVATSHCSSAEPEKLCPGVGVAKAFRTYPAQAPGLPEGRAYELVSPVDKHGGQVWPAEPGVSSCPEVECKPGDAFNHFPMQSSPDGEAIVYEGSPFSFSEGGVIENEYLARRGPSGWHTTNLTPAALLAKGGGGYEAFDPALDQALLAQKDVALSPEAPSEYTNLYLQPSADPLALSPLLGEAPPNRPPGNVSDGLNLRYAGASADLSRVFFSANDELNGEGAGGSEAKTNLYEWSGGQLHLVNVGPGEETIVDAGFGDGGVILAHAISKDGSRAFWSAPSGQVYLREDGHTTRAISTEGVPDPGGFAAAAADGSAVLLDNGHLHGVEDEEPTVDLTQGNGGFQGLVGQSEDLSHLYFVDSAVLSGEEENSRGAKAVAGENNLYAWEGGDIAFIATLLSKDNEIYPTDWAGSPTRRTAESSPDGRWLTFLSQAPLTGYDNVGPCEFIASSNEYIAHPCAEVFLYDSATGRLTCPSCNPSGAPPLGPSALRRIAGGTKGSLPQPRYLLDSGRLYFDSQDSLTPFDTNNGVEDVYQFEPQGVGSCKRQGGCVDLISAGRSGVDSNFLAVDASGKNVFFTSRDPLVGADKDQLIDLYDAREGGGIAEQIPAGGCQGEACQAPVSAPDDPTPASSTFQGAGNVEEPKAKRCPKGKIRKHGKCVKKHKGHRKHSHNRGGAK